MKTMANYVILCLVSMESSVTSICHNIPNLSMKMWWNIVDF